EFSMLVGFGALQDFDAVALQLRQHLGHVVDSVVDHETGGAGTEPFGVFLSDMPSGDASVPRLVIGPFEDRATPRLQLNSQVPAVPLGKFLVICGGLEESSADSCDLRHESCSSQPRSLPPGSQSCIGLPSGSDSLAKRPFG